jgi:hypothetical protein
MEPRLTAIPSVASETECAMSAMQRISMDTMGNQDKDKKVSWIIRPVECDKKSET